MFWRVRPEVWRWGRKGLRRFDIRTSFRKEGERGVEVLEFRF